MPTLVAPTGEAVESLELQLERLDKDIASVKRRKLITIAGSNTGHLAKLGPSDKVIYVEPFDLRGHDPEEEVEIIEQYVIESKVENDITVHKTGRRTTGTFKKRHELEPQKFRTLFGPTYKIDTSNANGEKECAEFLRAIETHTNRLNIVPQPMAYHSEVNNEGMLDLRNVTLEQAEVPVAFLENYEPLEKLIKQRDFISEKIKNSPPEEKPAEPEPTFSCDGCEKVFSSEPALRSHHRIHKTDGVNGKEE